MKPKKPKPVHYVPAVRSLVTWCGRIIGTPTRMELTTSRNKATCPRCKEKR